MELTSETEPLTSARLRLFRLGAQALTDAELLALMVGPKSAPPLLQHGLRALWLAPLDYLTEHPALEPKGAARLLAAFELSRRATQRLDERPRLTTPKAIHEYAKPHFTGLRREEMHVLCFTSRTSLVRHVRVCEGSVDQCPVDPREVFGPALACRATGIVLIHNHPSGDPEPSSQDIELTRRMRHAADLLSIKLLDHLVISDASYVSFLMRGLL